MIKQTFNQNEVITVKLLTGEEIVTYFVSSDPVEITIRKPVTLVAADTGIAMAPFIMTSDCLTTNAEIKLRHAGILLITKTNKPFTDNYNASFSQLDQSAAKPKLII